MSEFIHRGDGKHEERKVFYGMALIAHFGHLDRSARSRLVELTRQAYDVKPYQPVDLCGLRDKLASEMLIVGGENPISFEQVTTLTGTFMTDESLFDDFIRKGEQ